MLTFLDMSRDISRDAVEQPRHRAAQLAYDGLLERILSLELKPGEAIDEKRAAELLQLGRTPIREALIRLSQEDLVLIRPRRGTFVAPLDPTELRALEEMRFPLEELSSALAAKRATDEDIEELSALVDEAARTLGQGPSRDLDRRFHRAVAGAARNVPLARTLRRLYNQVTRYHSALGAGDHDARHELEDYQQLLDAIRAGEPGLAREVMRRHLRDSLTAMALSLGDLADDATAR